MKQPCDCTVWEGGQHGSLLWRFTNIAITTTGSDDTNVNKKVSNVTQVDDEEIINVFKTIDEDFDAEVDFEEFVAANLAIFGEVSTSAVVAACQLPVVGTCRLQVVAAC